MQESANDIEHFHSVFMQFEDEYYLECKANMRHQIIIAEQKHEIDKLNKLVENLKEGL